MGQKPKKQQYVALLRGINVGGHHKVPMAALKDVFEAMGFTSVKTILNSGNVLFETEKTLEKPLELEIADQLAGTFGFPIPLWIGESIALQNIIERDPFQGIQVHRDIRLYVSFIKKAPNEKLSLPWVSPDNSFRILALSDGMICSVLDLSISKTTLAMNVLEKLFNKDITTRNWNTVLKLGGAIESGREEE